MANTLITQNMIAYETLSVFWHHINPRWKRFRSPCRMTDPRSVFWIGDRDSAGVEARYMRAATFTMEDTDLLCSLDEFTERLIAPSVKDLADTVAEDFLWIRRNSICQVVFMRPISTMNSVFVSDTDYDMGLRLNWLGRKHCTISALYGFGRPVQPGQSEVA